MIIQHLQMKIVLTIVLVIRKLQGCVVLNKWLSSIQDSIQDQDHREIYRKGKITLADKGCLERVVHLPCGISSGYKMQSSIGQPMLVSLLTSVDYDKNKLQNRTGQPMLPLSQPATGTATTKCCSDEDSLCYSLSRETGDTTRTR